MMTTNEVRLGVLDAASRIVAAEIRADAKRGTYTSPTSHYDERLVRLSKRLAKLVDTGE